MAPLTTHSTQLYQRNATSESMAFRGEQKVEQPAWAAALQELHDTDGLITVEGKDSITESHPFVEDTHLSVKQALAAFDYLEHTGLIEPDEVDEGDTSFHKRGFRPLMNVN